MMDSFLDFPRKFTLAHPDVFYTNGILESFLEMTATLTDTHTDTQTHRHKHRHTNEEEQKQVRSN